MAFDRIFAPSGVYEGHPALELLPERFLRFGGGSLCGGGRLSGRRWSVVESSLHISQVLSEVALAVYDTTEVVVEVLDVSVMHGVGDDVAILILQMLIVEFQDLKQSQSRVSISQSSGIEHFLHEVSNHIRNAVIFVFTRFSRQIVQDFQNLPSLAASSSLAIGGPDDAAIAGICFNLL